MSAKPKVDARPAAPKAVILSPMQVSGMLRDIAIRVDSLTVRIRKLEADNASLRVALNGAKSGAVGAVGDVVASSS